MKLKLNIFLYYFLIIYFLEITFKFLLFDNVINSGIIYKILFTISISLILAFLSKLFNEKINKILTWIFTILLVVLFIGQYLFVSIFSVPFSFNTLSIATQALSFLDILINSVITYLYGIIFLLVPILFLIIVQNKINFEKNNIQTSIVLFLVTLIFYFVPLLVLIPGKNKLYSAYQLYYNTDAPKQIIDNFGLLTFERIDLKRIIFGFQKEVLLEEKPIYIL